MEQKEKIQGLSEELADYVEDFARSNELTLAEIVGIIEVTKIELFDVFLKKGE